MKIKNVIICFILGFSLNSFAQLELEDVIDDFYYRTKGLYKAKIVFKNYKKYLKKANKGDADFQYLLGLLHAHEDKGSNPVTLDYNKAISWFKKAAEQDHTGSLFQLGKIYYNGLGVTKDYFKSFNNFSKASNKGHSESQYFLANIT